ncbi:unnamed protein product [Nippostrongylus brasiliensis]|uniref:Uncharacterized protein n=1 Tax=Nippostrongylus brasiliensis TaxID=27835 RepID=A0A0N4Y577_NIPBR|nr:unnamed protein product [Nippostrongylus brasiliensis]
MVRNGPNVLLQVIRSQKIASSWAILVLTRTISIDF